MVENNINNMSVPQRKSCPSGVCTPPKPRSVKPIRPVGAIRKPILDSSRTEQQIIEDESPFSSTIKKDAIFEIANKIVANHKSLIMVGTSWDKWTFMPDIDTIKWYQFWRWHLNLQFFKNQYKRKVINEIQDKLGESEFCTEEIQQLFKKSGLNYESK